MPTTSNIGLDRVAYWIETRENRFEAFIPSNNHSSSYKNESNGGTSTPPNSSISSGFFEDQTADDLLHRCQDDPLIPSAEDIERTFWRGESQWRECLGLAKRQQTLSIPRSPGVLGLTQGVPLLPSQLCGLETIRGYPIWEFIHPEPDDMQSSMTHGMDDVANQTTPATLDGSDSTQPTSPPEVDGWNVNHARGYEKKFNLSIPEPTRYRLIEE
ncbi:hypothetical protein VC83_03945 [Pseudogymnoascus destructans]|uniref:Uncharacterized protein n=2 Tax=Pseudogymnoascus destructans TaxID=655981 RepID=L8FLT1_PSED2|nr:uncharacterized protein VC83_03945 [Pseudogymnoascus destructans]ELR01892.1 hypothetical protein GMDG_05074 [Pseudogymnoascus destructans 20631-21]OAF59656.1 hypothetical protein VC83_03945 [Pseudogymnoascus destructans]